jgi:HKD family nuclease
MHAITSDIGHQVLKELSTAAEARIAVAFFSPDAQLHNALCTLPRLTLIVSEEFTVNDPRHLEKLPSTSVIRSIPADAANGKLHAKVLLVTRRDRSQWVLVGSANMTWSGLFHNQEVGVALDSRCVDDRKAIVDFSNWFDALLQTARSPDLSEALKLFQSRDFYRLERRPKPSSGIMPNYWALKTTSGLDGMEHWPEFLKDNVLKIGWEALKSDPSKLSPERLRDEIKATFTDYEPMAVKKSAVSIEKFIGLKIGDLVVICRGFASNQDKPVHIYALARVTGPFRTGPYGGRTWRFMHDAVIQVIGIDLPVKAVSSALNKGSMRESIHSLDEAGFGNLMRLLIDEGIRSEV